MAKTYSQTYLFTQYPSYEKKMYEFILKAERVNANSPQFEDILYDIKRRKIADHLVKVLTSSNVILCINEGNILPKAFKVFTAKDVKEDNKYKCFIDVTGVIKNVNGQYTCTKLEWLISYIINATTSYIYAVAENKLLGNSSILKDGGEAFVRCLSYIVDRIYKISTVQQLRKRIEYTCALYYQVNLLEKDPKKQGDSIKANAIAITDIDKRDAVVIDVQLKENDFVNIDTFCNALARIFNLKDFKTSTMVSYWTNAFGTGTIFGMEFLPAFCAMITDTYIGGYINQQMTIEKIMGTSMVKTSKTILQIGASVA